MRHTSLLLLLLGPCLACAAPTGLLTHDPHPNDALHSRATPLDLDELIMDRLGPLDQDALDWKAFQLRRQGRVQISLTQLSAQGEVRLHVYKRDGERLGTLLAGRGRPQTFLLDGRTGLYYLEILGEAPDAPSHYALRVQALP